MTPFFFTMKNIFYITIVTCVFFFFGGSVFAIASETLPAEIVEVPAELTDGALTLIVDDISLPVSSEEYHTWVSYVPYLIYDPHIQREVVRDGYCPPYKEPCALRLGVRDRAHVRKTATAHINQRALREYIEDAATTLVREPVDATLTVVDDRVVVATPHTNGYTLPIEENITQIVNALRNHEKKIDLISEPTLATVRKETIVSLGLDKIIGEGRSNFAGSSNDRIHNIRTAASKFDDLLIGPGETFSFVENLGAVDGSTGYRKELVIKNNQTIPEYGGGVCQVSTTIFRGAILTGMKIAERRNHSYPVKYYEPMGFDATIYLPAPDMKFVNNTDGYILLDTRIEGTELIFRYFGTDDGREVVMDGPHVTSRGTDGSAKTYFTQKVVDASGSVVIDDTFHSNYRSPKAYPRAGDTSIGRTKLTTKPKDWSKKQWNTYKKENGL